MSGLDLKPEKSLALISVLVTLAFPSIPLLSPVLTEASGNYDLLIVGPESYRVRLREFLDFKATQGINANYFSIEWVDANFPGSCTVERLHDFIAREYGCYGIKYLLLVGTYEQVPTRYVYSPSDELGLADFNYKPSDWYYAVPDWKDLEVGFLGGNIPKIAVGRLPVKDEEELERTLRKIIREETSFQPGLFLILNDPGVNANSLLDALSACRASGVNVASTTLDESLFNNVTYMVSITHGNPDALFTRTADDGWKILMASEDVNKIGETYAVHYMVACFTGALDLGSESLARVLITSAGGPALIIASSRTEWSDNPILSRFWECFFATGDIGISFVEAVESYLLDQNIFSSSRPSFSSYNFYLNKVVYGDVSWRIKDPRNSLVGTDVLSNPGALAKDGGNEDPSNDYVAESVMFLHEKYLIAIPPIASLLGCILVAKQRKTKNKGAYSLPSKKA